MAGLLGDWLTPERKIALSGIGLGMSQLAAGQPVNLSSAQAALQDRMESARMKQALEGSGVMERFTPEQRAILASMPPAAAMQVISGEVFRREEPVRPIEVNGQLVNPMTGEVIGDYRTPDAGPAPTDDMREYEFARSQGYKGSFQDFMVEMRRAGATTINNNLGDSGIDYGNPPPDMAWRRNPDGTVMTDERGAPMAVVITGSSTDRKQLGSLTEMAGGAIDAAENEQKRAESTSRAGQVVLQDVARVKTKIENAPWYNPGAGFLGNALKDVAGTTAADVKALTTTIRANIGFDRLQQMREESPTGGALGQVAVQELQALQSVLGNIEQSQSESQLLENLDRLEKLYVEIMRKASAYPNADKYGFGGTASDGAGDNDPLGLFK